MYYGFERCYLPIGNYGELEVAETSSDGPDKYRDIHQCMQQSQAKGTEMGVGLILKCSRGHLIPRILDTNFYTRELNSSGNLKFERVANPYPFMGLVFYPKGCFVVGARTNPPVAVEIAINLLANAMSHTEEGPQGQPTNHEGEPVG
ncbi:unnamed protein product [Mesocestoides corti]|uniref:GMC_oxred_C domain-containing protein n=1 Tax=Mesocestoides corti TaxID=53468 RepID=A0A0R3UGX0_MESCO|nr:unnamed protein product [Mesocestoides corti]